MTDLVRPADRRTLHFGPWGLTGELPSDFSRQLLEEEMSWMQLGERVSDGVRNQFEKLKGVYLDGLFRYDHFTNAERDSYRVLEVALKVRFLQHYDFSIPLVCDGTRQEVIVHRFEDVRRLVFRRGTHLEGHAHFNGSFAALLRWARTVGYFRGQHNRVREVATLALRNSIFHSEHDLLVMPPEAVRSLSILFQWIQRLWGYDTPGGNAYPGLVPRSLQVVGLGPFSGEATWFDLDYLPRAVDEERVRREWFVVLAVEREDLGSWRAGFECTGRPVDPVWGPGTWKGLLAAVAQNHDAWTTDAVDVLDRDFFIRRTEIGLDPPRSSAQVRALSDRRPDERWTIIRADSPGMAMHHLTGYTPGPHRRQGPCLSCAADVVMSGSRRETVDHYLGTQPSLT